MCKTPGTWPPRALVGHRLSVSETGTAALRAWLPPGLDLVSCGLIRTELVRAVRRVAPDRVRDARVVLDGLFLLAVPTSTFESAGRLAPDGLRNLDALLLAAALKMGDDLEGIVAYGTTFAEAARLQGLRVLTPGA